MALAVETGCCLLIAVRNGPELSMVQSLGSSFGSSLVLVAGFARSRPMATKTSLSTQSCSVLVFPLDKNSLTSVCNSSAKNSLSF